MPVHFGLVCFRARPLIIGEAADTRDARLDALNETLMNNLNATGRAYLSHTRLNGTLVLRLAIGNLRTSEEHIRRIWELLNEQAALLS